MNKPRAIEFDIDDNGCFIITSHVPSHDGRVKLRIRKEKIYAYRHIYRECFGEIPEGMVLRHKCDNSSCINPEHMEIGTQLENIQDQFNRNRRGLGEKNSQSVLTETDVKEIKQLFGKMTYKELMKKFKVKKSTLWNIKAGNTWKHVNPD